MDFLFPNIVFSAIVIAVLVYVIKNTPKRTLRDIEKFWNAKFDGDSLVDAGEVRKPKRSFLRRLK